MSDMNPINGWFKETITPIEDYKKFQKEDRELRQVSKEFEAVLIKTMVKEGFQSARKLGNSEEDQDKGSSQFMDMAYEQMADHMAKNIGFGLSDTIYESLKQKL